MSTLVGDLPTESITYQEDMLEEEITNYEVGMKQDMVEKLSKAVREMEQEIHREDSVKLPAIDLLM